jgi:small nuclear ribonucleoprotein (snRNP)-like protein
MSEKINRELEPGYSINAAREFIGQQVKLRFKSGDSITGTLSGVQEKTPYMNLNAPTIIVRDEVGTKEYLLENIEDIQSANVN